MAERAGYQPGRRLQLSTGRSKTGAADALTLAGATAGTELAHRTARSHGDGKNGGTLRRLAAEIAQDRAALLDIMAALGIKVRRYKVGAAWIARSA
jgi:hypothetical protein